MDWWTAWIQRSGTNLLPSPLPWALAATGARNALAHTGQSPQHTLDQLYALAEVSTAVVLLNLLQELGIAPAVIADRMRDNRILGRAVRLSREFFASPVEESGAPASS